MTWAHRIRPTIHDAVFAGQEAALMREVIVAGKWPEVPIDTGRSPDSVSLREQVQLVQCLEIEEAEAVAESFGLNDFGAAGAAVLTSRDLHSAIDVMNAFAPLLNLRHVIKLSDCDNDFVITFHPQVKGPHVIQDSLLLVDLAKMLRFLRDLIATGHSRSQRGSSAMHDPHRQPVCSRVIDPPISRCGEQIRIPKVLFAQRLQLASPGKSLAYQRDCRRMMRELSERALCETVRRILLQCPDASPSVVQMASKLGMSIRTFRRRLASQHTTFLQILDEVRFQLAVRYLDDRQLTTELIAQKLGYSESANFRAAFRRWTGSSPRHFDARRAASATKLEWQSPAHEQVFA